MSIISRLDETTNKEKLIEYYVNKKMSTTQIAKNGKEIFGFTVSASAIYCAIIRLKIPIRDLSESISLARSFCDQSKTYLTEERLEWIDGFLLGDGGINFNRQHVIKTGNYGCSRFFMGSLHEEWVKYGMSKFDVYILTELEKSKNIDERHPNINYGQRTHNHKDIISQAVRWYPLPKLKKIIPKDVRITPTSVLLWYLGDGSLNNHHGVSLATCGFTDYEIKEHLISKLENHEIHCTIRWWKHYPYLVIRRNSVGKFFDFIGHESPIKCYDYKFDFEKWYCNLRISDIAKNEKEKWRAQWFCKNNLIEYSKSPGGKFFLFNKDQANKLRIKLNETGFDNMGTDKPLTNYISKHSVMGMMSEYNKNLINYDGIIKNKNEVTLFNSKLINSYKNMEKISLSYITENEKDTSIDGYRETNKFNATVLVSKFNPEYFKLIGKNNIEVRETRNHYNKIVKIESDIDDLNKVINLIDKWIDLRGEIYGWQCHAGHDKSFFLKFYNNEKNNLWSNFFYINEELVGYSIVSKENNSGKFNYIIRKNRTDLRNLCLYIDFKTFERINNEIGKEFYINWGASSGSLLKYKSKFPVYIKEKVYFIKYSKIKLNETETKKRK